MLFYQAALPLSSSTLRYVARLVRAHRRAVGVRWRRVDSHQQALMTLAWLRKGETYADLAGGFGVSAATVYRRVHETVDVLAARTPGLPQALRRYRRRGGRVVIVDGTLVKTDRVAADRPFYSGKHKCHGVNLQAVTD
ncbi:MAG TPA: transposase, partial [Candidatus Stackebrandtia faecavium]|nr:transposase [Candidatus Stackebrandtia faecavium]